MINALDEVLRELFIQHLPVKNGEIDIAFDQPKREWSARLNKPTLNVYLHDIRENNKLRQTRPHWQSQEGPNGSVTHYRRPLRIDAHYMITAWANEPEDEHELLTRVLLTLFQFPELPEDLLPESLKQDGAPIPVMAAQHDLLHNPADIWSALDNELRPIVSCLVTLPLNPFEPQDGVMVSTQEFRFVQNSPSSGSTEAELDGYINVLGRIHSEQPLEEIEDLHISLLERALPVKINDEGKYVIRNIKPGTYTLEVTAKGRKASQHKIVVPDTRTKAKSKTKTDDYDLQI